jgi:hypothetical protein
MEPNQKGNSTSKKDLAAMKKSFFTRKKKNRSGSTEEQQHILGKPLYDSMEWLDRHLPFHF